MKSYSLIYLLVSLFLIAGCQQPEGIQQLDESPYFSVGDLMNQQISLLDSLDPQVKITGSIQQQQEAIETQKDSSGWEATLKLFSDADINQPVLQGLYTVTDTFDQQRNLDLRVFQAKKGAKTDIPYLKVYFQDTIAQVRRIETLFEERNLMYDTQRKMSADFDMINGQPRMIDYETIGTQKMIFQDSVRYQMTAKLDYGV